MESAIDVEIVESNVKISEHINELEKKSIAELKRMLKELDKAFMTERYSGDKGTLKSVWGDVSLVSIGLERDLIREVLGDRDYRSFFEDETRWGNVV